MPHVVHVSAHKIRKPFFDKPFCGFLFRFAIISCQAEQVDLEQRAGSVELFVPLRLVVVVGISFRVSQDGAEAL